MAGAADKTSWWVLPVIIISQFFCTSMWFAGNAVVPDIIRNFHLEAGFLAHLTSAVQLGFISGTFVFALLSISDRFSPSTVFFVSALLAASFNLGITLPGINAQGLLLFRFLTGFFLAGIYPVGMKIAADYYRERLGRSLGFLVGALVLGTAFPHLLKSVTLALSWQYVAYATSTLAVGGGSCVRLFLPDGPYRTTGGKLNIAAFLKGFTNSEFRAATFGYFGHMWELYSFWAFVPLMLTTHNTLYPESKLNVPLLSFLIIASGSLSCILGGMLSPRFGPKKLATIALGLSCACCLCSPLFLCTPYSVLLLAFLFFWAMVVIADSPLFATVVSRNAPAGLVGSSLTMINCIGFSITIVSIQFINAISPALSSQYLYMLLAIGPVFGLAALFRKNPGQDQG